MLLMDLGVLFEARQDLGRVFFSQELLGVALLCSALYLGEL